MADTKRKRKSTQEPQESKKVGGARKGPDVDPTIYNLEELMKTHKTKSAVIRLLNADGFAAGAISRFMNIRPQHAYNVINSPLKRVQTETK
jgi:hypothetical protein